MRILKALCICAFMTVFAQNEILYNSTVLRIRVGAKGQDRVTINCTDLAFRFDFLADSKTGRRIMNDQAKKLRQDFGTDLVYLCQANQVEGSPYFYASNFVYVVDSFQYELGFDEYAEVKGSEGQLRQDASVQVVITLQNGKRGEPITLYYNDESIKFTPPELP